jgi:hypothetical protein
MAWSKGAGIAAIAALVARSCGLEAWCRVGVAGGDQLAEADAGAAAVAAEVDVLDAEGVGVEVAVGVVAEAGVLVLLLAGLEGDGMRSPDSSAPLRLPMPSRTLVSASLGSACSKASW